MMDCGRLFAADPEGLKVREPEKVIKRSPINKKD
jgi:hypothetical protein